MYYNYEYNLKSISREAKTVQRRMCMDNLTKPNCLGTGVSCDGECCDECDYLICCTKNVDELSGNICGECFEQNGGCPIDCI